MTVLDAPVEDVPVRVLGDARCHLGEGPAYDAGSDTAWWFEILEKRLHEVRLADGAARLHTLLFMASARWAFDVFFDCNAKIRRPGDQENRRTRLEASPSRQRSRLLGHWPGRKLLRVMPMLYDLKREFTPSAKVFKWVNNRKTVTWQSSAGVGGERKI